VLQRLTTWLWYIIVLLIVLLAAYSSFGRLLLTNLSRYQDDILREINARINFVLEIDELKGSWRSLTPTIEATGVRVLGDQHAPVGLSFEQIVLELDVLDTLRSLSPRLYTFDATGGRMHVDVGENGELRLAGMPDSGQANLGPVVNDFIFNAEALSLGEMAVELHSADWQRMSFVHADLQRDGDFRRFLLSLRAPDRQSWFRLTAEGRGELSDFRRFEGIFHLQSSVGQLASYEDLFALAGMKAKNGVLDSDFWLSLDRGAVEVAVDLSGRDFELLAIDSEASPIRLERLGVTAAADFVDGLWHFRAREIELTGSGEAVAIDRLTGSYGNNSLSLRLADLQLGELSSYLERVGLLPDSAASVLGKLSPRGRLERVEFSLDDLADLGEWQLSTNFSNLDVSPWKGAPGLTNASGFAELQKSGGRVQLASSEFSMSFPAVFKEPLDYRSFSAELEWSVQEDAFRIRSGPFRALAEEGEVGGLFSLRIPRIERPAGSEMELMVALRDTSPEYRRKYLPSRLNPKLLDWLKPAIGKGSITEGGFIYRGNLVGRPEHRTVQLFFDVEDTHIDYHSDWPAVDEMEGLVLIDDADVDVYAHRGRLLDSELSDLRAHIRTDTNGQLHLELNASMTGGAADGLSVVNNSPLRSRVGDLFADWQLDGALSTQLQLKMNLSNMEESPDVKLRARFTGVDVDMVPLGLVANKIEGELRYLSATGFAADAISGELWGEAVSGVVSQELLDGEPGELDIAVSGPVQVAALREWLALDLLALAEGRADADMHILVPTEGGVRLEASSTLVGVTLDLPSPWSKTADESRVVSLEMPLGEEIRELAIVMEGGAQLAIELTEDGFSTGSLGFGVRLPMPGEKRFLVGGELDRLDWSEWQGFIDSYLATGAELDLPVSTSIRDLRLGQLLLFGQDFRDVNLSGQEAATSWHFDFSTDWVRGGVDIPDDLSLIDLKLETLDVDGFGERFTGTTDTLIDYGSDSGDGMPPAAITISEVRYGENSWGNLSLHLRQDRSNLHFEDVRGNLRHLQLGGEEGMQLDWLRDEGGVRTRLAGTVGFLNFGEVLAEYQYEQVVETNSGRVEMDLGWPGDPTDFELRSTRGNVVLDVDDGRFLTTSGAAEGTLRVVGILNLAEFVRRLSLDLSQVYKSGVPFDSIQGELNLQEGIIEVPSLDVRGRGSRFQFVGLADTRQSTIDGELVATLPIASNLPWMFALASGLPAAAGVYVISKLFNKQMDRFSSAVYRVEGPWVDPEVRFERIFDDSASDKAMQTAETADNENSVEKVPET
jgi:uncharacterized protein (TIGR02099 family)